MSNYLKEKFPDYDVKKDGTVYEKGIEKKPFNSNGYKQLIVFDKDRIKHTIGVHTLVAMQYISDFFEGCIVHHKDKNRSNNNLDNLEVYSQHDHRRMHALENKKFMNANKNKVPWNKGMKMDEEFSRKCKEGIKNSKNGGRKFHGNQYVDENHNVLK